MITLKLSCPDQPGLVATLTRFIQENGGNMLEMQQFTDQSAGWFFTHMMWEPIGEGVPGEETVTHLRRAFDPLARELGAQWTLRLARKPRRVAILVTKETHCLIDLLTRVKDRHEFPAEIVAVIGNRDVAQPMAERFDVPFHHVPVDKDNKGGHFEAVDELLDSLDIRLAILARYMQIVPAWMCEKWSGRMINIHHSFLPAFAGANPYQRAFERGVKVIGATAHYVTADLDEGPIIAQEIAPVEHYHTPADLLRLGRDCERLALAKAVRYHLKDRVLIHGNKTVVFRD